MTTTTRSRRWKAPPIEAQDIRVSIASYKGRTGLDIREWYRKPGSRAMLPGKRGVRLPLEYLPVLIGRLTAMADPDQIAEAPTHKLEWQRREHLVETMKQPAAPTLKLPVHPAPVLPVEHKFLSRHTLKRVIIGALLGQLTMFGAYAYARSMRPITYSGAQLIQVRAAAHGRGVHDGRKGYVTIKKADRTASKLAREAWKAGRVVGRVQGRKQGHVRIVIRTHTVYKDRIVYKDKIVYRAAATTTGPGSWTLNSYGSGNGYTQADCDRWSALTDGGNLGYPGTAQQDDAKVSLQMNCEV